MTVPYPELAQLLEYDPDKMQRVVWEFYRSTTKDLRRLEQAAVAHQRQAVRDLARRIQTSCLQVGERTAAEAAAAVAGTPGEYFAEACDQRRSHIEGALDRAEQFVAWRISGHKAWPGSDEPGSS
jgi:HPt (histidine-containing phosphotransfer) domain-containing protein